MHDALESTYALPKSNRVGIMEKAALYVIFLNAETAGSPSSGPLTAGIDRVTGHR